MFTLVGIVGTVCLTCALVLAAASASELYAGLSNNTGALAWPFAIPILFGVHVVAAMLATALLSGLVVLVANELGRFDPWPRSRVRLWSTACVAAAALGSLPFVARFVG